jgi:hypothetical protein
MPDLFHDLEIHGAPIRLRYCEHIVHINIHSMHDRISQRNCPLMRPTSSMWSAFGDKAKQPAINDLAARPRAL